MGKTRITAFVGSARKKHTYNATEKLILYLQKYGEIEYEIVSLNDYHLEVCKGCKLCLDKGEELCPLRDDRDKLIEKIKNSAGIIFASPNYSFNVSGLMKVFLDRLGYAFHRPQFFGKAYTSIVVQGIYGGSRIQNYFDFIGNALGFNVVKGCCLNSLEPMTEKEQTKTDKIIEKQSRKYYSALIKKEYPIPSYFQLMIFRMARTSMNILLDESWRDYAFYKEKGWFESDYYYPTQLNRFKKLIGKIFDQLFLFMYKPKKTAGVFKPQ